MEPLVSTEWLAGELGAPDLRVVDATYHGPTPGPDPATEFDRAHIPGAVFLDLATLADAESPLPSMLPPPAQFAARLQALGLGDDTRIVLYDAAPHHTAARAWWMFRVFGVRDVAILDGGWAKWLAEGRPVTAGDEPIEARPITLQPDTSAVRTRDDMAVNLTSKAEQVIDARPPARFLGREPDLRPNTATGHIPGSLNLPQTDLFEADGTWKRGERLRAAFAAAGIDPDRPMVATCGSGITAAVLVFGAHLLGRDAALYDGSWAEWGADPATPKATA